MIKNFWKNRVFYNLSLAYGMIFGILLEKHIFSSGRQGWIWRLYESLG